MGISEREIMVEDKTLNRILIVDDDSFNQMSASLAIKKLFPECKFEFADNGQQAVEMIKD